MPATFDNPDALNEDAVATTREGKKRGEEKKKAYQDAVDYLLSLISENPKLKKKLQHLGELMAKFAPKIQPDQISSK